MTTPLWTLPLGGTGCVVCTAPAVEMRVYPRGRVIDHGRRCCEIGNPAADEPHAPAHEWRNGKGHARAHITKRRAA